MVTPVLDFSIIPELPSSQFSQKAHSYAVDNVNISSSSSNSGLLDELIGQAQAMVCNDSSRSPAPFNSPEERHMVSDFELFYSGSTASPPLVSGRQWSNSTSLQPSTGKLFGLSTEPSSLIICLFSFACCLSVIILQFLCL